MQEAIHVNTVGTQIQRQNASSPSDLCSKSSQPLTFSCSQGTMIEKLPPNLHEEGHPSDEASIPSQLLRSSTICVLLLALFKNCNAVMDLEDKVSAKEEEEQYLFNERESEVDNEATLGHGKKSTRLVADLVKVDEG
ncbi:hypothetical protein VNO78_15602 [Psophocarpus tetragonolobus]|uniref:Uncharacterized protein n=1 Tax=Psophocarpus tetragonolobus TaxID=3891 RepID=A0AAN9SFA3_PSOTE